MSFFKNLGHAIASGAKKFESIVLDAVLLSSKAQALEPAAVAVIGVVAGPQAATFADLGFHALGDFATALEHINEDALQATAEKGLVVTTDLQTLKDIKAAAAVIKNLLAAKGTPAPTQ